MSALIHEASLTAFIWEIAENLKRVIEKFSSFFGTKGATTTFILLQIYFFRTQIIPLFKLVYPKKP